MPWLTLLLALVAQYFDSQVPDPLLAATGREFPRLSTQEGKEERGKYKLTYFGREAGTEEYRLEEFEDGQVVLFSKAKFEVEVQGSKQGFLVDAALTMRKDFAPVRYAALHKSGAQERQHKIEWQKGAALSGGKEIKTPASLVLDNNLYSHFLPILRRGSGKVKVFCPAVMADVEFVIVDKGEVVLRGSGREVRAREFQVVIGALGVTAHMDEKKRLLRMASPMSGGLAELEGFEGLSPERRGASIKLPPDVEEGDVLFPSGTLKLAGSVTRPKGGAKCPAVVLISGSGPQDRNGNMVRGRGDLDRFAWQGPDWDLFKAIAYALSAAGVLVLRYDDRGCGKSEGDLATARLSDLVADAEAAAAFLRARDDVGAVGLVGHSEGAVIAPILAARDERVRAIFLLAGTARPLDSVLLDQLERRLREQGGAAEAALEQQRALFTRIKAAKEDTIEIDERPSFIGWLREHFNHDPQAEISRVKGAVVIFQGMKDGQVFPEHADLLEKARPGAEVRRFADLDHLFMKSDGRVGEYADPDRRVDAGFLKTLADDVVRRLR